MPVQFICERCHKLLKVGRRKIGAEVTCPKCGQPTLVPDEETAAVGVAMHTATRSAKGEAPALPEFAVFDDDLLPPPAVLSAPAAATAQATERPAAAPPPVVAAPRKISTIAAPRYSAPAAPRGPMLLVPRNMLYVQAVLFTLLALAAFGAGYLVGKGSAPAAPADPGSQEPVVVEGTLTFTSTTGNVEQDQGAVVMLIPAGEFPDPKWSAEGLSPRNPEPAAGSQVLLEVEEIGARYARTDERGYYLLAVPVPGAYRLLFVSRNSTRPTGEDVSETDLNELRRYFTPATQMIGRSRYHWAEVELASGDSRKQSHDFGIDRQ